jgi:hypothetical protein
MFTTSHRILIVCSLLLTSAPLRANDIEDFFKALRGGSSRQHQHVTVAQADHGHVTDRGVFGPSSRGIGHDWSGAHSGLSSRDLHTRSQLWRQQATHPAFDRQRYDLRHDVHDDRRGLYRGAGDYPLRHSLPVGGRSQTHLSFRMGSNSPLLYQGPYDAGPVPIYTEPIFPDYVAYGPSPGVVSPEAVLAMPHQLGEIVTCQVPLATCVIIEDPEKIAPNGVPVIVAVRDPNLPPCGAGCVERLAYVQVCVPRCPMRKLSISRCKTRIEMEFGDYEVKITSSQGRIVVDYDN